MSGPYDNQGGYGQNQQGYNYNNQGGYGQQPYGAQQGYGAPPAPSYGQPQHQPQQQQQGGYGGSPPQFQHGQQAPGYSQDPYQQQQQYQVHPQYDQQQSQYGQQGQQQPDYNQGGPWGQGPPPSGDPNNPYGYNKDPSDPNNPQEGERGFLGAVAGGWGGHHYGGKYGHGSIGTLAGAFLGSKMEDKVKGRSPSPGRKY